MRAFALLAAFTACKATGTFACERDDQCRGAATAGRCESTGFCSFVDPSCPSGSRYDPYAGDGLANHCVGDLDGGIDGNRITGFPSHVDPGTYHPSAPPLSHVIAIDTTALTLDLGSGPAVPPAGITFVDDGAGHAVLSVGTWTVDQNVRVTGAKSLVVVAAGAVAIDEVIDGSADHEVAGPGAATAGNGADGAFDAISGFYDSGGGGGGFGTAGAAGGNSSMDGGGGTAGASYGSAETAFGGGSSGGIGGSSTMCPNGSAGHGGGGGGAIQVSSAASVVISSNGGIDVGGGGGRGGCNDAPSATNPATAGGGGGAGGEVFVEAPTVMVAGTLTANGGGGGGGALAGGNYGGDGSDGLRSAAAAVGGIIGGSGEGPGGNGAFATTAPGSGKLGSNAGGGGGSVGWIWLRSRGPASPGGVISPPPQLDPQFP
jgi:hypothetical protein